MPINELEYANMPPDMWQWSTLHVPPHIYHLLFVNEPARICQRSTTHMPPHMSHPASLSSHMSICKSHPTHVASQKPLYACAFFHVSISLLTADNKLLAISPQVIASPLMPISLLAYTTSQMLPHTCHQTKTSSRELISHCAYTNVHMPSYMLMSQRAYATSHILPHTSLLP